ncbi:hypothetical protein AA313_de0206533 [Arthrobotrys entomopaga]|nr:hypothetical protein AA313_de0206533 [Arthrobotrys entomopaga]
MRWTARDKEAVGSGGKWWGAVCAFGCSVQFKGCVSDGNRGFCRKASGLPFFFFFSQLTSSSSSLLIGRRYITSFPAGLERTLRMHSMYVLLYVCILLDSWLLVSSKPHTPPFRSELFDSLFVFEYELLVRNLCKFDPSPKKPVEIDNLIETKN